MENYYSFNQQLKLKKNHYQISTASKLQTTLLDKSQSKVQQV